MKILTMLLLGAIFACAIPCPVDIEVSIDGTKSYYDIQNNTFTWDYVITTTGCINNDVDWYIAFNHIDPDDYMITIGQSGHGHKGQIRPGVQTLLNPGIQITIYDKLAIWGYAECPWHPDEFATDLDYAPIRIK